MNIEPVRHRKVPLSRFFSNFVIDLRLPMRTFLLIPVFLQCFAAGAIAKTHDIVAYLKMASFSTGSGKNYMETYLDVSGKSIIFKKDSAGKWQGEVNVKVFFKRGDTIIEANNYNLHSPRLDDSNKTVDFIDVQRYVLPKGIFTLQISIQDINNPAGKAISSSQKVSEGWDMDSVCISDAEFLASYSPSAETGLDCRNGYKLIPYVNDYYPDGLNQIDFYAEIYNTSKVVGAHNKFVLKYFIESYDTHTMLNKFSSISIKDADTVTACIGGFNIANLPSGRYLMVIEVLDNKNNLRAMRSFPFIRHNKSMDLNLQTLAQVNTSSTFVQKFTSPDSVYWFVKFLLPISNVEEQGFINNLDTQKLGIELLKQFFYNFWQNRYPNDPGQAWRNYYAKVQDVNKEYSAMNTKGFQTDRGRVYLKYGAPNQRFKSDMNPNTYPYEIWEYYQLSDGETDRKFVFYDPDLVTNNYLLLYSNAMGEIQNRRWQQILQSRSEYGRSSEGDIDNNSTPDPFGEFTQDQFSNPH